MAGIFVIPPEQAVNMSKNKIKARFKDDIVLIIPDTTRPRGLFITVCRFVKACFYKGAGRIPGGAY